MGKCSLGVLVSWWCRLVFSPPSHEDTKKASAYGACPGDEIGSAYFLLKILCCVFSWCLGVLVVHRELVPSCNRNEEAGTSRGRMPVHHPRDFRIREVPVWRRPAVSILMLIAAAILPLPARARQRMVTPGISPAQADVEAGFCPAPRLSRSRQPSQLRFSITSGAALKGAATTPGISPARADVAPGFSPAPRLSRSRQPFQLRFPNTLGAALKGAATTPGISPAKPSPRSRW